MAGGDAGWDTPPGGVSLERPGLRSRHARPHDALAAALVRSRVSDASDGGKTGPEARLYRRGTGGAMGHCNQLRVPVREPLPVT